MKKQLMCLVNANTTGKFFKTAALVLMISGSAYAGNNPGPGVKNAVIRHLSSDDNSLLFEIKLDNENGEKFTVVIKDNTGTTLYRGVYSDRNFSRKFQLPKTDMEKLVFTVKNSTGNKTEAFEVNSNTRMIEEVVVTKLN